MNPAYPLSGFQAAVLEWRRCSVYLICSCEQVHASFWRSKACAYDGEHCVFTLKRPKTWYFATSAVQSPQSHDAVRRVAIRMRKRAGTDRQAAVMANAAGTEYRAGRCVAGVSSGSIPWLNALPCGETWGTAPATSASTLLCSVRSTLE